MSSIFITSNSHVSVLILLDVFTLFDRDEYSLLEHSVLVASRMPCSMVFLQTLQLCCLQSPLLAAFLFSNSQWWIVLGVGL